MQDYDDGKLGKINLDEDEVDDEEEEQDREEEQ